MSLATQLVEQPNPAAAASGVPHVGLVRRARVVRDFVLLITVCLSIGLAAGLCMMITVFVLL